VLKTELPLVEAVQVIPSLEYAILFVLSPLATHTLPLVHIDHAVISNIELPFDDGVQFIPSSEYAIGFVLSPTATHRVPLVATPNPCIVRAVLPLVEAVQVIASVEYASLLDPFPAATQSGCDEDCIFLKYAIGIYISCLYEKFDKLVPYNFIEEPEINETKVIIS